MGAVLRCGSSPQADTTVCIAALTEEEISSLELVPLACLSRAAAVPCPPGVETRAALLAAVLQHRRRCLAAETATRAVEHAAALPPGSPVHSQTPPRRSATPTPVAPQADAALLLGVQATLRACVETAELEAREWTLITCKWCETLAVAAAQPPASRGSFLRKGSGRMASKTETKQRQASSSGAARRRMSGPALRRRQHTDPEQLESWRRKDEMDLQALGKDPSQLQIGQSDPLTSSEASMEFEFESSLRSEPGADGSPLLRHGCARRHSIGAFADERRA